MKLHNVELDQYYIAIDTNNGRVIGDFETALDLIIAVDHYTHRLYSANFKEMFVMSKASVEVRPKLDWWLGNDYIPTINAISVRKNIYVLDSRDRLVDIFHLKDEEERQHYINKYKGKWHNPHREYSEQINDLICEGLLYRKNNVNKIKEVFLQKEKVSGYNGERYFRFVSRKYYSRISTLARQRDAVNVLKDEGEPKFRGKRGKLPIIHGNIRGKYYTYQSWKHNSKRRKQWKPK
jgi:hypothetical protein